MEVEKLLPSDNYALFVGLHNWFNNGVKIQIFKLINERSNCPSNQFPVTKWLKTLFKCVLFYIPKINSPTYSWVSAKLLNVGLHICNKKDQMFKCDHLKKKNVTLEYYYYYLFYNILLCFNYNAHHGSW